MLIRQSSSNSSSVRLEGAADPGGKGKITREYDHGEEWETRSRLDYVEKSSTVG